jgi:hypothetical protein
MSLYVLPISFITNVEHGGQKFIFTRCGLQTALSEVNGVF